MRHSGGINTYLGRPGYVSIIFDPSAAFTGIPLAVLSDPTDKVIDNQLAYTLCLSLAMAVVQIYRNWLAATVPLWLGQEGIDAPFSSAHKGLGITNHFRQF
jgi:hypothetical protein